MFAILEELKSQIGVNRYLLVTEVLNVESGAFNVERRDSNVQRFNFFHALNAPILAFNVESP